MGKGCQGLSVVGALVKHFNRATLFANCKHGPLTMGTSGAPHFEFGNLRAVCTGETRHRSEQAGTCRGAVPY